MNYVKNSLTFFCFCAVLILIIGIYANAENNYVYSSNDKCGNKIAITFDDGPHPKQTRQILKILEKYGVKATFFVVGVNVKNYPDSLKQVIEKGHEIGNHTYSHSILKPLPKEKIKKEIEDTQKELFDLYGYQSNVLRPPCGSYDNTLIEIALEKDLKIVLWNVDTKDWAHTSTNNMVNNVLKNIKGGDIILFHDYISGKTDTCNALNILIPKLQNLGYEFVTVSELLQEE